MRVVQVGVLALAFVLLSFGSQNDGVTQSEGENDGVTQSEGETVVLDFDDLLDTIDCAGDRGVDVGWGTDSAGNLTYSTTAITSEAQPGKPDKISVTCEDESDISAYQLDILADGVTQSEIERAVLDTVECVREQGFESWADFDTDNAGNLTYSTTMGSSEAQVEEADEVFDACDDEHLSYVGRAWADVIFDPDLEDRFEAILLNCLEEHGFDVDRSKPAEAREFASDTDPEQFHSCFDEAAKVYEE